MSDNFNSIIDQDWSEIAIDDGTILDQFGKYHAKIYPRDAGSVLTTEVDNISYSPEVNTAKKLSIDVEPLSELENEDYLGGVIDVFVNGKPIFSGEIDIVNTHQNDDGFYSIEAKPPARKLKDQVVNETTDNDILSDYLAKIIDKYNEWDDEHFNLVNTSQENLSNVNTVNNETRISDQDGATATYTDVGADASAVDIVYAKIDTIDDVKEVQITVDDGTNTYSESFTDEFEGTYGQWVIVEPSGLDSSSYDIIFTLDEAVILYDWISLTTSDLTREIEPDVAEQIATKQSSQFADTDAEFNNIVNIDSTDPFRLNNGEIQLQQYSHYGVGAEISNSGASLYVDTSSPPDAFASNNDTDQGEGYTLEDTNDSISYSFTTEYEWEAWRVLMRFGDTQQPFIPPETEISFENETSTFSLGTFAYESQVDWDLFSRDNSISEGTSATVTVEVIESLEGPYASTNTFTNVVPDNNSVAVKTETINSGEVVVYDGNGDELGRGDCDTDTFEEIDTGGVTVEEVRILGATDYSLDEEIIIAEDYVPSSSTDRTTVTVDVARAWLPVNILGAVDSSLNYSTDNAVDSNYNLSSPTYYPGLQDETYVVFNETVFSDIVTKGYIEVGGVNDSSGVEELGVSFDSGNNWFSGGFTESFSASNPSTTSSLQGRVGLSRYSPNGNQNKTPTFGYAGQSFGSVETFVDISELEILFAKDVTNNRLKALTNIADDSRYFYRWEGNQCLIFKRGSRNTDVTLREEEIESSVNKEDVYSSCEVIGANGVSSGVIQADNSPDYIDRHKEIRDPDIENQQDAIRRANSFLAENSTIDYSGSIRTLPTLAPIGEEVDGSKFNHGQDMYIDSVRYSKRKSTIDFGYNKQLKDEILKLDRNTESTNTRDTS
jgi:hypothetical protein